MLHQISLTNTVLLKNNNKYTICFISKFFFFFSNYESRIIFYSVLSKFFSTSFIKFYFSGKSFKVFNKKIYLNLDINRAHINYLFFKKNIILWQFLKNRFSFKVLKQGYKSDLIYLINKARKLNIFTHRGIKCIKSIILKKKGKISTYTQN